MDCSFTRDTSWLILLSDCHLEFSIITKYSSKDLGRTPYYRYPDRPGDAAADRAVAGVLSRGAASAVVAVAVGLLGSSSCCWRCCNCGCWDGGRLEEARPLQLKINNLLINYY